MRSLSHSQNRSWWVYLLCIHSTNCLRWRRRLTISRGIDPGCCTPRCCPPFLLHKQLGGESPCPIPSELGRIHWTTLARSFAHSRASKDQGVSLHVPQKIKVFWWHVSHKVVLLGEWIGRRVGWTTSPLCPTLVITYPLVSNSKYVQVLYVGHCTKVVIEPHFELYTYSSYQNQLWIQRHHLISYLYILLIVNFANNS